MAKKYKEGHNYISSDGKGGTITKNSLYPGGFHQKAKSEALKKKKDRFVHEIGKGYGKVKTAESEHTKHYDQKSRSWKD